MKTHGILLTQFDDQDFVAEILQSMAAKTVVFGRAELRCPWGLRVDLPGRAVFHIVLQGRCWIKANGYNPLPLSAGDTVLFPSADVHDLNNHPSTAIRPLQELLIKHPMTQDRRFCFGGTGAVTVLLCGAFRFENPKLNLLGMLLPSFLHIKSKGDTTSAQLRAMVQCIETELKTSGPGEAAIVTRMAEAFLLRAIRDHLLSSSLDGAGLSAILKDECIGRVVGAIHRRPDRSWTVAALAREAHLSRSAFAVRFKLRVGDTPQRYLQRYRFSKAVQLLQTTHSKLDEIARRVGYESEPSFSKAFRRVVGTTPGSFR